MQVEVLQKAEKNWSLKRDLKSYTNAIGDRFVGEERRMAYEMVEKGYLKEYKAANGRRGYFYLTALGREYLDGLKAFQTTGA